jgi:integrase
LGARGQARPSLRANGGLRAAATGLRPEEWIALERRDVDPDARVVYVRRAFTDGRLKCTKTEASVRAVPLQAVALATLEQAPVDPGTELLFPSPRGAHLDLRNFRTRIWKPAQHESGIEPLRRVYDLRHTFATFALRAGISTFDLSRYMGASLTMIDRHYGHLARDGREHAIKLLDLHAASEPASVHRMDADAAPEPANVHRVDAGWTSQPPAGTDSENGSVA